MGLFTLIKNFLAKFNRKARTEKIVEPLKTNRDILFENSNIKSNETTNDAIVDNNTIGKQYKIKEKEVIIDSSINQKYEAANINYKKGDDLSKWEKYLDEQLAHLEKAEANINERLDPLKRENTAQYKPIKSDESLHNISTNLNSINKFIDSINLVARYKERKANNVVLKGNYIIDIDKKLKSISNHININIVEAKVEYNRLFEIINTYNPKLQRIYKDAIQENNTRWNTTLSSLNQKIIQRENEIAQEAYKNVIIDRFEALEKVIPTDINIAHKLYSALFDTIEESLDILNANEQITFDRYKTSWSKRLKQTQQKIKQRAAEIAKEKYENEIQNLFDRLEEALNTEDILEVRSIGHDLEEKLKPEYKAWQQKLAKFIEKGKVLDKTLLSKAEQKIKEETYALEQILALNNTSEIASIQQRIDNGIKEIKNTYPQLEVRFNEVKSKLKYLVALKAEEDKQAYIAKIDELFKNLRYALSSENVSNIRSYIQSIQKSIEVDYKNWNSELFDAKSRLAAIERRIREEEEARERERQKQQYIEEIENEFSNLEYYINNENTDEANRIINRLNYNLREDYNNFNWRLQQARYQVRAIEREEEERRERIRREREEEERRERASRASLDAPSKKSNWTDFRDVLQANGISRFYHFTARENIAKIKASGGLYSWYYLENNDKYIPVPGGDNLSRSLDRRHGLQDYVRLSFTSDHPMAFRLKQSGHDIVVLAIDIEVAYFEETRFSNMNAAANDHKQGKSLSDLKRVNFAATKERYVKRTDPIFPYIQAEVMVKTHIPLKYIKNIDSF